MYHYPARARVLPSLAHSCDIDMYGPCYIYMLYMLYMYVCMYMCICICKNSTMIICIAPIANISSVSNSLNVSIYKQWII